MNRTIPSTMMLFFFLTACSGSGGYGGPGDPPPPPAGLTIDSANGFQVSQVAFEAIISSGGVAGMAGGGLTADSGGNLAKPTIRQRSRGIVAVIAEQVVLGPEVVDCAAGGTLTVTMDIIDLLAFGNGELTAGDTILQEYAACNEGFGETIDGVVDSEVDAFAGNILANIYDLTMTLDLADFQVATATDTIMANGDGTAVLNNLQAPYVEVSVSGNSMTTDTNSSSETLSNYSSAQTLDAGLIPAPYTMTAFGTLDSSQLDGIITYSTPDIFQGFDAGDPTSGELLIAGDEGSARVIAQANGIDVVIEIYSNTNRHGYSR